jgi:hypothetical protein
MQRELIETRKKHHLEKHICSTLSRSTVTAWSRVLKKLIVAQLVKLPTFYGTRSFITVLTRARHGSLSSATCIHCKPSHPLFLKSTLISSSHIYLSLPNDLVPSGSPTKICYAFVSPIVLHALPTLSSSI